jgi:hypothetical protein
MARFMSVYFDKAETVEPSDGNLFWHPCSAGGLSFCDICQGGSV